MPVTDRVFVVIPVHNRRDITRRCLRHLRETGVSAWARAIVVDDGSSDGTGEAIAREHPEVDLLTGDGRLWWGGAIRLGMKHAMEQGADFVFWLNDDCFPEPGAMESMLALSRSERALVTAQTYTDLGILYSGCRKTWTGPRRLECGEQETRECDFSNGNCVCIPAAAVDAAGLPRADEVPHMFADNDFGLMAGKRGFRTLVLGRARCRDALLGGGNVLPEVYDSWLLSDRPIAAVWKDFSNPKSGLYLRGRWNFFVRHWGLWGGVLALFPVLKLSAATAIRAVLPVSWLRAMHGKHSLAWRLESLYGGKRGAPAGNGTSGESMETKTQFSRET